MTMRRLLRALCWLCLLLVVACVPLASDRYLAQQELILGR